MNEARSAFDIIGPTMVGPSSSHTVGAIRIARVAATIVGNFDSVRILLHGSYAETCRGHGTDKALLAGLMGFSVDDERIIDAYAHAKKMPWKYSFESVDLGVDRHPNSVRFVFSSGKREFTVEGASIGGGKIIMTEIDGLRISKSFFSPTLILKNVDEPGSLAKILSLIAAEKINVSAVTSWTEVKGKMSITFIELESSLMPGVLSRVAGMENVKWANYVEVDWRGFA